MARVTDVRHTIHMPTHLKNCCEIKMFKHTLQCSENIIHCIYDNNYCLLPMALRSQAIKNNNNSNNEKFV